jgi:topoisomerase-4 subunit A
MRFDQNYHVTDRIPQVRNSFWRKHKGRENEIIEVAEFIGVKSHKARGKRLTSFMVDNIQEIEPVVKKEAVQLTGDQPDEEPRFRGDNDDPAQMKLEL